MYPFTPVTMVVAAVAVTSKSARIICLTFLKPQAPVCTLPDGRLIDGKNTLQSFDGDGMTNSTSGTGGGISTTHTLPCKEPAMTLPDDGRLINGKNTLQSLVDSNYPHDGNVGLTTTKQITSCAGADVVGSTIFTTAHAFAVAERQQPTVDHIMSTNHYSARNANDAEACRNCRTTN